MATAPQATETPTPDSRETVSVEKALEECGGFGSFQKWLLFSTILHMGAAAAPILSMVFVAETVEEMWNVTSGAQKGLLQSATFIGWLPGAFLCGWACDVFGRRRTLLVTQSLVVVGSIVSACSFNFAFLVATRIFIGFNIGGVGLSAFALLSEYLPTRKRGFWLTFYQMGFAIGLTLQTLVSYVILEVIHASWRFAIAASVLLSLSMLIFSLVRPLHMPESARFLLQHGKLAQATQSMHLVARVNGRHFNSALTDHDDESDAPKLTALEALRQLFSSSLLYINCAMMFIWMANSIIYYGITFLAADLSSSAYLSELFVSLVEVPAYIVSPFLIRAKGRRYPTALFMVFAGVFMLILIAPLPKALNVLVAVLGKFFIAGSFAMIYTYSSELYPTSVRGVGMGLNSAASRVGGIVTPLLVSIAKGAGVEWVTVVVFAACALISALLCVRLPETKGRPLLDYVGQILETKNAVGEDDDDDGEAVLIDSDASDCTSGSDEEASGSAPESDADMTDQLKRRTPKNQKKPKRSSRRRTGYGTVEDIGLGTDKSAERIALVSRK